MVICSYNLDNRLGCQFRNTFNPLSKWSSPPDKDFFFVVHPDYRVTTYEEYICTTLQNGHCKGILFVSGSARCGLCLERANALKNKYDGKVHFLSYAVAQRSDLPPVYEERFKEFFSKIENENIIDWGLIDPTYPESIVAALLLLQAAPFCSEPENWQNIWKNAVKEYNSLSDKNLDEDIKWDNKEKIQEQIEKLKTFLSDRQA